MEVIIEFIEESSKQNQDTPYSPLDLKRSKVHSLILPNYHFSEIGSRADLLNVLNRYLYYLNRGRGKTYSSTTKHKPPDLRQFEYDAAIHTSQIKRELRTVAAGLIADILDTKSGSLISNHVGVGRLSSDTETENAHSKSNKYLYVKQYFKSAFFSGTSIKTTYT